MRFTIMSDPHTAFKEIKKSLIEFHAKCGRDAYKEWAETGMPDSADGDTQNLAFRLLEHTAQLYRLTGDEDVLTGLQDLPDDNKCMLVRSACAAIDVEGTISRLDILAQEEDLDGDDLLAIENTLLHRDTLGLVQYLAERTAFPLLTKGFNRDLSYALGVAQGELKRLDAAFKKIPKAVLTAGRVVLDGVRQAVVVNVPHNAWWLRDPVLEGVAEALVNAFKFKNS